MAEGDITMADGKTPTIELLTSRTSVNGAPSGDAGIALAAFRALFGGRIPDGLPIALKSTAGSGTMTVSARLWIRLGSTLGWFTAGSLNAGSAIAETSADSIQYSEVVDDLDHADRAYIEITAIAGTGTSVGGYLGGRIGPIGGGC